MIRAEQEIFDELAGLCASPGYAHAVAYLCFRDNMIRYSGEMKAEDMQHLFSKSRLIRTETSTLIGLMLKNPIDYTLPSPPVLEKYIEATEALLEEIHHAMSASFWQDIDPTKITEAGFNPFMSGAALREPIFYGGESAYSFQYRDFAPAKYANDDPWLIANKGFSIQDARNVVLAVSRLQDEKAISVMRAMKGAPQRTWTFLPGNAFSVQEVAYDPAKTVDGAASSGSGTLTLKVEGLDAARGGQIVYSVYTSEPISPDNFITSGSADCTGPSMTFSIKDVPFGPCAIFV